MIIFNFINNIRRGFATNSSSSHSMVYFKNEECSDLIEPAANYETEYGWGFFSLRTLGDKLMYALTSAASLRGLYNWSEYDIDVLMEDYGHLFPEFTREHFVAAVDGYVDHQSVFAVTEKSLKTIRDPHVVIFGGNDNSGPFVEDIIEIYQDAEYQIEGNIIRTREEILNDVW